jgi:fermentation-respiration switch protein FrsA (DUF1100 family)
MPRRPRLRWASIAALALALLLAAPLLAALPAAQRSWLALLVLLDIQAGDAPSLLKEQRAAPRLQAADLSRDGRHHLADRHLPADRPPRATLVLLHGFTAEGRREPRLMHFARTMARAGFAVLVPELDGLRSLAVGIEDAADIGAALRHELDARAGTDCRPVGVMALSFAVGPALIAALAPEVRERIDFVVAVGGYYDLDAAITYATTGFDPLSGRNGVPQAAEGRWWLLQSQAARLTDPAERALLGELARRHLAAPDPEVDDLLARLGSEGRALHVLTANTDPQQVATLIAALPAGIRTSLKELDLARRPFTELRARLLLIHGSADPVIPVSHSRLLRERFGPERARLFVANGLEHVDVAPRLADVWPLWQAVYELLRLTEQPVPDC